MKAGPFWIGAALAVLAGAAPQPARAEWLQPDATYRDAQLELRAARRDTLGHADDAGRLDTLGVALLRLTQLDDAARVFRRVLELKPGDPAASAGLGRIALFRDQRTSAESLLVAAGDAEGVKSDLLALRLRQERWLDAAKLAGGEGEPARSSLWYALALASGQVEGEPGDPQRLHPPYEITPKEGAGRAVFVRGWPVPLVRAKVNGVAVLLAIDTGASDLLLDPRVLRLSRSARVSEQRTMFWCGRRVAVGSAIATEVELAGFKIASVPASVLPLRKYSLEVNPQGEAISGVIGLNLLRHFEATLDFKSGRLELRRGDFTTMEIAPDAQSLPFELWGESELTVYGSINGGRKMALVVQTGVPACGVGAPPDVFEEVGVKPSTMSRLVKTAGGFLQGTPWTEVQVPAVVVGPIARDKIAGWSGALDPTELWRHGVRRDALLGGDFFRGKRVRFDWSARVLMVD